MLMLMLMLSVGQLGRSLADGGDSLALASGASAADVMETSCSTSKLLEVLFAGSRALRCH